MDAVKIGQLTQADVYVGDDLCVGRFSMFEEPKLEHERVTHSSLGMVAELETPSRMLKAMKGKGECQWLDVDLMRKFHDPATAIPLTLDGYTDVFGPAGVMVDQGYRMTWHLTLLIATVGGSQLKFGKDFKGEFEYTCWRYVCKATSETVALREIDVFAQINRVNGRDVWPRY